jgi:uncharacterized membrane protein YvlD (DUF360 family)
MEKTSMLMSKSRHLRWNLRLLYIWGIVFITAGILVVLLPGISNQNLFAAIFFLVIFAMFNAWIRPTLIMMSLPPTVTLFGIITLTVNSILLWLGNELIPGLMVTGFWSPLIYVVVTTAINLIFCDLFAIDDDDSYYAHLVYHIVQLGEKPERTEVPGVLFLEIDGLSEPVLRRAIECGQTPTLARWLESGSHRLVSWECDLSSQTSASQAGILLGSNFDVPAFRWYEKEKRRRMVSNRPMDTAEMERRLSTGDGLLADQGASRSNLFSGDAPQSIFTFSTIADMKRKSTQDFYPLLMGPYNFFRLLFLFLLDLIAEIRHAWMQRRRDEQPRVHRGGVYPLLRAVTTILMREISIHILIGDMIEGVPCVYTTFVGYDEVAHHSGVERPDAIEILHKLDEQFDRLEDVLALTPRPYHFVILSDHGQSQGATFKQRYGTTLEQLVRTLVAAEHSVESILNDIVPDSSQFAARLLRRFAKPRMVFNQVVLGPYRDFLKKFGEIHDPISAEVIVLASGNLGLIYLTELEERMTHEQINDQFPGLIDGLAKHDGIGFLLVQSEEHGPMAIGGEGINYLESGEISGEDPLPLFGPNAATHLMRTNTFPHTPDILVNSLYDPESDEVAAFEELVGSHGGLGGNQTKAFIMFPVEWELTDEEIVGAGELHKQMKGWLAQISS